MTTELDEGFTVLSPVKFQQKARFSDCGEYLPQAINLQLNKLFKKEFGKNRFRWDDEVTIDSWQNNSSEYETTYVFDCKSCFYFVGKAGLLLKIRSVELKFKPESCGYHNDKGKTFSSAFNWKFGRREAVTEVHVTIEAGYKQAAVPITDPCTSVFDLKKFADLSDVTIKGESGLEIKCHKLLLAQRSDVFATMFSQDMKESRTGVITIDDFEKKTVKDFVEYLYQCDLKLDSFDCEMLAIANKYDVTRLQTECERVLSSTLDHSNAATRWKVSKIYDAKILKEATEKYFVKHLDEIWDIEDFDQVNKSYPCLMKGVLLLLKPR